MEIDPMTVSNIFTQTSCATCGAGTTKPVSVLAISLHPRLSGYIGGGGFDFVFFAQAASTSTVIDLTVLENSPTMKDAYGIGYNCVSFGGEVQYELFLTPTTPIVPAIRIVTSVAKSIILGIRLVRTRGFQAVLSPNERMPNIISNYVVSRLTRRPCVMLLHLIPGYESAIAAKKYGDFTFRSILEYQKDSSRKLHPSDILRAVARYVASKMASQSICITNNAKFEEILRRSGGYSRIKTCRLGGVDEAQIMAIPESSRPFDAIYVSGLISPQKGGFDVLKAWSLVVQRKPSALLVVVGRATLQAENSVRELIRNLELERNVAIPFGLQGVAERKVIYQTMKRSKILLYPSYKDADPGVVKEALACGLPVIMYDAEYATGVHTEMPFLRMIEAGNVSGLAEEFLRLSNQDLGELSDMAVRYSKTFTNAAVFEKQFEVIRSCLSEHNELDSNHR